MVIRPSIKLDRLVFVEDVRRRRARGLMHVTSGVLRGREVSARMGAMSSVASSVDDLSWDQRIVQLIDPGVDGTLIAENLRRTPTERLRRMQEMARFLEHARCDRRPATP